MTESVRVDNADLVTLAVLVDGKKIPDTYLVPEIHVEHEVNRIPLARVTIADGSAVDEDFAASASAIFSPGGKMEVQLGYHASNTSVFKGLILRQNIRIEPDGNSSLVLVCNDEVIKTAVARSSIQFQEATDSDVIGKLLGDAGLSSDVEATTVTHEHQVKNFASDWDFILSRAEANGQLVIAELGKVSIAAPKFSSAKYIAEFGDTITQLDLELDATSQLASVTARAWDHKTQKVVIDTSSEPSTNQQGNIAGKKLAEVLGLSSFDLQSQAPLVPAELKSWANAQLLKSRLARVRGRVEFTGNSGIHPGDLLDLAGLGKRFNGSGYVSSVCHRVSEGNWLTEVQLGLPREWFSDIHRDVSAPGAAGLRPGVSGLQIAKVMKIDEDPQGERRIQVDMPLQTDGGQGIWVRNVSPYATNNAGIEFMPEIGDEVVLGFLNGDPSAGIILGSLHSSALPSPNVPDQDNTIKAIVSNSQIKISFDDVKKVLTLETPGGHVVTMSDDEKSVTVVDSNSNKLELTESGVTLSSPKDISIKATGSVSIEGQTGVTISSPADVGVKGANTTVEGNIGVTAKGGATAELSAGGQTTVKGAMVMIN